MKAKIRKGATIGQDMGYHKWPHHESYNVDQIFEVFNYFEKGRKQLIAKGFGQFGEYGNGALFVKEEDLIEIDQ